MFILFYGFFLFFFLIRDGNLSDIARAGSLHEFLVETHARFGPITGFWWGQVYVVSIASPELFKAHANVFDKPCKYEY